jgi:hypothetical protein
MVLPGIDNWCTFFDQNKVDAPGRRCDGQAGGSGKRPRAGCRARDGVMQCCSVVKVLGDAGGMPCETYVRFHYYMEVLFGVKRFGRDFWERWGQMAPVFRGRRWQRRFDAYRVERVIGRLLPAGHEIREASTLGCSHLKPWLIIPRIS